MNKSKRRQYFDPEGRLIVRPYRTVDLCAIFEVNYRTIRGWIDAHSKEIGDKMGYYYTGVQVERMVALFGRPHYPQAISGQKEK